MSLAGIENRESRCNNRELSLNSRKGRESSANLLLNGTVSHLTLLVSLKYFYLKQQADRKLGLYKA